MLLTDLFTHSGAKFENTWSCTFAP